MSFNRPARHNAIDDELGREWRAAVMHALDDDDVRCVLLCGEGRSFCSGRDTAQLGQRAGGESDVAFVAHAQEIRIAILESPKPVVAAVQGYALGGGFETALSADMRIAADDAVFAFPEIGFGLIADTGGTQLLTPLIGPAQREVPAHDRRPDRRRAGPGVGRRRLGGVARRAAGGRARARRELGGGAATAVAFAKQLVDQAWAGCIRNGMRQEVVAQAALFASDDYQRLKARRGAP